MHSFAVSDVRTLCFIRRAMIDAWSLMELKADRGRWRDDMSPYGRDRRRDKGEEGSRANNDQTCQQIHCSYSYSYSTLMIHPAVVSHLSYITSPPPAQAPVTLQCPRNIPYPPFTHTHTRFTPTLGPSPRRYQSTPSLLFSPLDSHFLPSSTSYAPSTDPTATSVCDLDLLGG